MPFHWPTFTVSAVILSLLVLWFAYKRSQIVQPAVVTGNLNPRTGPQLQPALLYATLDPSQSAPKTAATVWDNVGGNG